MLVHGCLEGGETGHSTGLCWGNGKNYVKKKKKSRLISLVMLCGYHVPLSPITHDKKGLWKICGYFPPNPYLQYNHEKTSDKPTFEVCSITSPTTRL